MQNLQDLSCSVDVSLHQPRCVLRPRVDSFDLTIAVSECCLLLLGQYRLLRLAYFVAQWTPRLLPYLTLKPNLTVSVPRSRYRLLVRLYLAGLCSRYTSTVYRQNFRRQHSRTKYKARCVVSSHPNFRLKFRQRAYHCLLPVTEWHSHVSRLQCYGQQTR